MRERTDKEAIFGEAHDIASMASKQQSGRMAGARVSNYLRGNIDGGAGCRDILAPQTAAEHGIEPGEDLRRVVRLLAFGGETDLEHGSDKSGGNAIAGDVGDQDGERGLAGLEKVEEIACHEVMG